MSEGQQKNIDLLMTRMPGGKTEASIGFDRDEFVDDMVGLFKQEQTNGLGKQRNFSEQVRCVEMALLCNADEVEVHQTIADALLQAYPTMKLPSRNKRAKEFLDITQRMIQDRRQRSKKN